VNLKNQTPKNMDKLEDDIATKESGVPLENNQIYTS
jgi:hypothetical protein